MSISIPTPKYSIKQNTTFYIANGATKTTTNPITGVDASYADGTRFNYYLFTQNGRLTFDLVDTTNLTHYYKFDQGDHQSDGYLLNYASNVADALCILGTNNFNQRSYFPAANGSSYLYSFLDPSNNTYVQLPSITIASSGEFSVSFSCFVAVDYNSHRGYFFQLGQTVNNTNRYLSLYVLNRIIHIEYTDNNTPNNTNTINTGVTTPFQFLHIALTISSSGICTLYAIGVNKYNMYTCNITKPTGTYTNNFIQKGHDSPLYFCSYMDEFRIYNGYTLSQAEVNVLSRQLDMHYTPIYVHYLLVGGGGGAYRRSTGGQVIHGVKKLSATDSLSITVGAGGVLSGGGAGGISTLRCVIDADASNNFSVSAAGGISDTGNGSKFYNYGNTDNNNYGSSRVPGSASNGPIVNFADTTSSIASKLGNGGGSGASSDYGGGGGIDMNITNVYSSGSNGCCMIYFSTTVDLSNVLVSGSGSTTTGYQINGIDISNNYIPYTYNTGRTQIVTGFRKDNVDIGTFLQSKDYIPASGFI